MGNTQGQGDIYTNTKYTSSLNKMTQQQHEHISVSYSNIPDSPCCFVVNHGYVGVGSDDGSVVVWGKGVKGGLYSCNRKIPAFVENTKVLNIYFIPKSIHNKDSRVCLMHPLLANVSTDDVYMYVIYAWGICVYDLNNATPVSLSYIDHMNHELFSLPPFTSPSSLSPPVSSHETHTHTPPSTSPLIPPLCIPEDFNDIVITCSGASLVNVDSACATEQASTTTSSVLLIGLSNGYIVSYNTQQHCFTQYLIAPLLECVSLPSGLGAYLEEDGRFVTQQKQIECYVNELQKATKTKVVEPQSPPANSLLGLPLNYMQLKVSNITIVDEMKGLHGNIIINYDWYFSDDLMQTFEPSNGKYKTVDELRHLYSSGLNINHYFIDNNITLQPILYNVFASTLGESDTVSPSAFGVLYSNPYVCTVYGMNPLSHTTSHYKTHVNAGTDQPRDLSELPLHVSSVCMFVIPSTHPHNIQTQNTTLTNNTVSLVTPSTPSTCVSSLVPAVVLGFSDGSLAFYDTLSGMKVTDAFNFSNCVNTEGLMSQQTALAAMGVNNNKTKPNNNKDNTRDMIMSMGSYWSVVGDSSSTPSTSFVSVQLTPALFVVGGLNQDDSLGIKHFDWIPKANTIILNQHDNDINIISDILSVCHTIHLTASDAVDSPFPSACTLSALSSLSLHSQLSLTHITSPLSYLIIEAFSSLLKREGLRNNPTVWLHRDDREYNHDEYVCVDELETEDHTHTDQSDTVDFSDFLPQPQTQTHTEEPAEADTLDHSGNEDDLNMADVLNQYVNAVSFSQDTQSQDTCTGTTTTAPVDTPVVKSSCGSTIVSAHVLLAETPVCVYVPSITRTNTYCSITSRLQPNDSPHNDSQGDTLSPPSMTRTESNGMNVVLSMCSPWVLSPPPLKSISETKSPARVHSPSISVASNTSNTSDARSNVMSLNDFMGDASTPSKTQVQSQPTDANDDDDVTYSNNSVEDRQREWEAMRADQKRRMQDQKDRRDTKEQQRLESNDTMNTMSQNKAILANNMELTREMQDKSAELAQRSETFASKAAKLKEQQKKSSLFGWF